MTMKELTLARVYQLIEPGPVVLLTTARNGRVNVMTMSWHMMVEFEPPLGRSDAPAIGRRADPRRRAT